MTPRTRDTFELLLRELCLESNVQLQRINSDKVNRVILSTKSKSKNFCMDYPKYINFSSAFVKMFKKRIKEMNEVFGTEFTNDVSYLIETEYYNR